MLLGHEPRAPFAAQAPPQSAAGSGAALQTCPDANTKGDLNVTLPLETHPPSLT